MEEFDVSAIEQNVCRKIEQRAEVGLAKYGVSVEDAPLSKLQWLRHAQEEAMDFAVYIEKLIQMEEKK